jgi:hypothetical protein
MLALDSDGQHRSANDRCFNWSKAVISYCIAIFAFNGSSTPIAANPTINVLIKALDKVAAQFIQNGVPPRELPPIEVTPPLVTSASSVIVAPVNPVNLATDPRVSRATTSSISVPAVVPVALPIAVPAAQILGHLPTAISAKTSVGRKRKVTAGSMPPLIDTLTGTSEGGDGVNSTGRPINDLTNLPLRNVSDNGPSSSSSNPSSSNINGILLFKVRDLLFLL